MVSEIGGDRSRGPVFEMTEEHLDFLLQRLSLKTKLGGGALEGELPDSFIVLTMNRAGF